MREIQFKSVVNQEEVSVQSLGLTFKNGQIKQVTDEQAEALLKNINFVEVTTSA